MSVQGIEKIKIPVRPSEVGFGVIEKYLPKIFEKFLEIRRKIKKDYDFYRLDHPILNKTRAFQDSVINNKILVPSVKSMVDWKVGYVHGNPISYAQSKIEQTDDIEYLNKYDRDTSKSAVDVKTYTWAIATGVGYYFIEPKSQEYDTEAEAPYNLYHIESDRCVKVYSSYLGEPALFDIIYTTHKKVENDREYEFDVLDVYLTDKVLTYEKPNEFSAFKHKLTQSRGMAKPLPLVEKRADETGIGLVSLCRSMQIAIDQILSNGLDNIEEVVNQIFVYKNIDLGETPAEMADNHNNMVTNGAIVVKDSSPDAKADVGTIKPELNLTQFMEIYTVVNKALHDSAGVPMEQSNTNSGGTTKSGSEVANGYENAYNRAMKEKNILLEADNELLKKVLWICKNSQKNKINNISASDIEIKYNFNITDNILIKTQSFGTLINYMPPDMALRICRLSNDPEREGKRIEDYMATLKESQEKPNQNITE
jgi:SPP1 family phage portal protein